MESKARLVGNPLSLSTQKVMAVARQAGVELEYVNTNSQETNYQELLSKSPTGGLPYLETTGGVISQSTAILYWVGQRGGLVGKNEMEQAQVHQWITFAIDDVSQCRIGTVYPVLGHVDFDQNLHKLSMEYLKKFLKVLDNHVKDRTYLVGDSLTIADVELWSRLRYIYTLVLPHELSKKQFGHAEQWFVRISSEKSVLSTCGPTHLCKAVQKAPVVKHHTEKEKSKPQPEKKVEKTEEVVEEKPKDPLSLLPPSKCDFDAFKKDFLNTTDQAAAMKRFWDEYYDSEGYSLYKIVYDKLPTEGKVLFKTTNAYSFFIQKLDMYRKYCFAAFGVYGVEENFDIKGVWCWRGQGVPFFMEQHESFEYYKIQKLDHTKEEDRKLVEDYWLNLTPGTIVDGQPVAQVETFK